MKKDPRKWHKKFVWYPIKVNGQVIWFDYVWRVAHPASWEGNGEYGGMVWVYLPGDTDIIAVQVEAKLKGKPDYKCGEVVY